MTVQKGAPQDDYYAQVSAPQKSDTDDKKPVKLKLKAVVKKSTDEEVIEADISTLPSPPVKIVKKVISQSPEVTPESASEISSPAEERPKARLVEREHAGSSLMRSVMNRVDQSPKTESRDANRAPKISFAKVETKFKPLENRPVMPLPPGEGGGYKGNRPNRNTGNTPSTPSSSSG